MPEHRIDFEVRDATTVELPNRRYAEGKYRFSVDEGGGVQVFGNRDGLLYLADVFARLALGQYPPGLHVHLPDAGVAHGPDLSGRPEITVYSAATGVEV